MNRSNRCRWHRAALCYIVTVLTVLHSAVGHAGQVYFSVHDASQIYYLAADDRIYLRNLSWFSSGLVPGTSAYWLDLATPTGKALFTVLLSSAARGAPIMLAAPDSGGAVVIGGYWYN